MQGTVNKLNNNGRAFSAEVDGQWYGAGFDTPSFQEGDVIEFGVEQRGKFKNLSNARKIGTASGGSAPVAAEKPGAQVWVDKDNSILHQSCRKDALLFVDILLKNAAVSLPAKKGDQADAIQALLDDYTVQFFVSTREVVEKGGCVIEDMFTNDSQ